MKIEGLVTNVAPGGSPDRAGRDILGMNLDVFGPIQAVLWYRSHFVVDIPS